MVPSCENNFIGSWRAAFGEAWEERKRRADEDKVVKLPVKVQTRSLIQIKCSWLDWVKQKQQQADWREALFTPQLRRPQTFLWNVRVLLPCGQIPVRSRRVFCFVFPGRRRLSAFFVDPTRILMFPVSPQSQVAHLTNSSVFSRSFGCKTRANPHEGRRWRTELILRPHSTSP